VNQRKWLSEHRKGKAKPLKHAPGILLAMDLKSGSHRWTVKQVDGTLLAAAQDHGVLVMGSGRSGFTLVSDVTNRLSGFDIKTGRKLWAHDKIDQNRSRPLIHDRKVIVEPNAYDLKTGKPIAGFKVKRTYGCGPMTAGKNLLLLRSGTLGYLDANAPTKVMNYGGVRPGCWINAIPVAGMVVMPDAMEKCNCSYLNKATVALEQRAPDPLVQKQGTAVQMKVPRGFEIRYTLDGGPPKLKSKLYKRGIRLPAGATLKAKVFKHGMPPSETVVIESASKR
jgi:hypothetical protein